MADRFAHLKAFIMGRQTAYRRAFNGAPGEVVLQDLAKFCRANESTHHEDTHLTAIANGRREVWLRIQQHLKMSPDDLAGLLTGQPAVRVQQEVDDDGNSE